jgi:4-amino-4-deoxy-L-arabinose transferase-like glycosyltransferase
VELLIDKFISNKHFVFGSLLLIAMVLIFWGLGKTHLIPWDEAIYAKIAKNMVTGKSYLSQTWWGGLPWFEKPPFYMWSMALFMKILGFTELAARLPSAIFGLGTVILVYLMGVHIFKDKVVGFLSGFALLTTFHFLYYSRASMLDVTSTFFVTLSLYVYFLVSGNRVKTGKPSPKPWQNPWTLAGLSCGFAVLTKGVVGFLPIPIIFLNEIINEGYLKEPFSRVRWKNYWTFGLACIAVFLPWHLIMYVQYGNEFLNNYIGYHVITRATQEIEDKGMPIWWYLEVMKVSMRIWFVVLLAAFPFAVYVGFWKDYKSYRFLVIWSVFVLALFSLAKSKLVWYIMPIYPAVSLMVGYFMYCFWHALEPYVPPVKNKVFGVLAMYGVVCFGLLYLILNKELVYPGDLTGAQAQLLVMSDEVYEVDEKVYVDRIELPLVLFYSEGPFEVVDFGPLKDKLAMAGYAEKIIFITKESRYRAFKVDYKDLELEGEVNEWVLAHLPSKYNKDRNEYEDQVSILQRVQKEVDAYIERGEFVPVSLAAELKINQDLVGAIEDRIAEGFGGELPADL